ncbi:DUF2283 domain-containing protein [Aquisalimonas sp.]|uniref:DUF2283 domain-containing protein n=1 Tax=Aquisalimonas sp. TaxID=1872621 RepID=UPI0025BFC54C|nr:DUF2283 domain-containing protein [Aquisalimonas sp.]
MKEPYLEVTFRRGKPLAAYLYLPREAGERSFRTSKAEAGMVIDFGQGGNPIGIELTAPTKVSIADLNHVLIKLGLPPMQDNELAPLRAA